MPHFSLTRYRQRHNDRCWVVMECRIRWKFRSCRSSKFFNISVVAQRPFPMILRTTKIPQLHVDMVDRRSCCAGGASSTGAVVEKTVVLPRLHSLGNSLRSQTSESLGTAWAAHFCGDERSWGFFRALHTGTGPGAVSSGLGSHYLVLDRWRSWIDIFVIHTVA